VDDVIGFWFAYVKHFHDFFVWNKSWHLVPFL